MIVHDSSTMEKVTQLTEPLSDSESELEEGEIANDDIEIVYIKTGPASKRCLPPTLPSYSRKTDSSSLSANNDVNSKRQKLNSPLYSKSENQLKTNPKLSPLKKTSPLSRSKLNVKKEESRRNSTYGSGVKSSKHTKSSSNDGRTTKSRSMLKEHKREDPVRSQASSKDADKDLKWRQSFEMVNRSEEKVESDSSASEIDEEMELRLAALNSVVVNAKPKNIQDTSFNSTHDDPQSDPLVVAEETQVTFFLFTVN